MNEQPTTPAPTQPAPAQQSGITIAGRRFTLPWVIGGVVAILVVLTCGCCGTVTLASALTSNGKTTTAQVTATSHQQDTQATAQPSATTPKLDPTATHTTSGGQTVDSAVLGGTEIAFIQSGASETYIFKDNRTFQGSIGSVGVQVQGKLIDGTGGKRFWWLQVTPLDKGTTWNSATANAIARQLIPDDARYVKDVQVPDFGLEHIYVSKTLAASFPASAFEDASTGQHVTPGTFYISCGNTMTERGGCIIQTGQ